MTSTNSDYLDWMDKGKIELIKNTPFLTYRFPRTCDVIKFTHIVLDYDPEILTNEDFIAIKIGNNVVYKTSLRFLYLMNKTKKYNDKYVFPINIMDIQLYATAFNHIDIQISINDDKFKKIIFLIENTYLKNDLRRDVNFDNIVKYETCISKIINSNKVNFILDRFTRINEYYIDCDIKNIKSISVKVLLENTKYKNIDLFTLLEYDDIMVKMYLENINNRLVRIPLNIKKSEKFNLGNNHIKNTTKESFIIQIEFFEKQDKITLYSYDHNILRHHSGIANLSFFKDNVFLEALYENFEYNEDIYEGKTILATNNFGIFNFDDLGDNLIELKISELNQNLLNLPINLKKLEILNNKHNYEIKVPFDCEFIEK